MKKSIFVLICASLALSACLPSLGGKQTAASAQPQIDIQGTAAAAGATIAAQTLSANSAPELIVQASNTAIPTETPVVITETLTASTVDVSLTGTAATSSPTATGSNKEIALAGSGTPGLTEISIILTGLAAVSPTATLPPGASTLTNTVTVTQTLTETAHPQTYGTLPPSVPFGTIVLVNKAQADVYVSLQVVLADGSTTVLEYPVEKSLKVKAPAGRYFFVAWVGGKQMTGSFHLSKGGDAKLTFNKKNVEVTSN